jgi:hypothetical protein
MGFLLYPTGGLLFPKRIKGAPLHQVGLSLFISAAHARNVGFLLGLFAAVLSICNREMPLRRAANRNKYKKFICFNGVT